MILPAVIFVLAAALVVSRFHAAGQREHIDALTESLRASLDDIDALKAQLAQARAARSASDHALAAVVVKEATRQAGMCSSLTDCARMCHRVEQAEAQLRDVAP